MADEDRKAELIAMSHDALVAHVLELDDFIDSLTRSVAAHGDSRRMLLQAGTWLDQMNWEEIEEPYALVQLLHLVDFAFRKMNGKSSFPE